MAAQSLADRLRAAMNEARKQRDQPRTLLLSTILSDIKNREIELNRTPTDDETAEVLRRGVKRRRESVEAYEKAGRATPAGRWVPPASHPAPPISIPPPSVTRSPKSPSSRRS